MQLGKSSQYYNESYFCVFYLDSVNISGEPESWRYNYYIVRGENVTDSRIQSHGYTITASAASDVSLPTSRAPIHEDITIASSEDEVSRTNRGELRHGSIVIESGGQEESPSNARGDHHRGITSKFYVHKSH